MVRVLFSLMLGKKYVAVEMESDNGYEVSGEMKSVSEMTEDLQNDRRILC